MEPGQCCSYGEHSPECPCESRIAELEAEVERLKTFLADEFVLDGLSPEDATKAVMLMLKEGHL